MKNTPLKELSLSLSQNNYSCNENEIDGKYYNLDLKHVNYNNLYDELPMYKMGNISEIEKGVYMWVLITCEKKEPELYFMKVETKNEIGSKHSHMMYRLKHYICQTENILLHYAGEFKKEEENNDGIEWNFASGTYMLECFKEIEDMGLVERERRRNIWIVDLLGYLEYNKIKGNAFAACDSKSYVSDESCPLTKEILDKYKRHGVKIYEMDNMTDCKNYMKYRREWDRYKSLRKQYEIILQKKKKEGKMMLLKEPSKPVKELNLYGRKY